MAVDLGGEDADVAGAGAGAIAGGAEVEADSVAAFEGEGGVVGAVQKRRGIDDVDTGVERGGVVGRVI